jgi:hypothetical protein
VIVRFVAIGGIVDHHNIVLLQKDMDHGQYNRKVEYAYYIHLLLEQKVISDN